MHSVPLALVGLVGGSFAFPVTARAHGPRKELQKKFGFEPDRVAAVAKDLLAGR
jgi:hypothetical protein